MSAAFIHACESEWLKRKRSLASWLVLGGALFTPAIVTIARLLHHDTLGQIYRAPEFWNELWRSSWESMAIFFLPLGAILITSLLAQMEFKNNAWKQVHTSPLSLSDIFFSKLTIGLLLLVEFVLLFNIAIYVSGVLPSLAVRGVPYPSAAIPLSRFLKQDLSFLLACLPIVTGQYLISLRFRNFLVPVGIGFMAWVGALAALPWKYGYLIPYSYTILRYLTVSGTKKAFIPAADIHLWAAGYSLLFVSAGFILFATKRQKG